MLQAGHKSGQNRGAIVTHEMKHTPGPWHAVQDRNGSNCDMLVETENFRIATCGRADSLVAQANANLIAAAPELLSACKATVADAEKAVNPASRLYGYEALKAAIAKAEGQTP